MSHDLAEQCHDLAEQFAALTADLYVRADTPTSGTRTAATDRLERLDSRDRLAGFSVHRWPSAIRLDLAEAVDHDVHDVFRAFEEWANRAGRRVRPPFDVRRTRSTITGETAERLVLPTTCLAVYGDGDLLFVAPSSDDESTLTVKDALDALSRGRHPLPGARPFDASARVETDRPAGSPLPGGPDGSGSSPTRELTPTTGGHE